MWAQVINILLGLWLMAAPGVFSFSKITANNDHILGPVMATFAITALWECTHSMRKWNIPLGAWLLVAPWILGYENNIAIINDMAVGLLVIGFSLVKGKTEHQFGGGWSALWHSDSLHVREARQDNTTMD